MAYAKYIHQLMDYYTRKVFDPTGDIRGVAARVLTPTECQVLDQGLQSGGHTPATTRTAIAGKLKMSVETLGMLERKIYSKMVQGFENRLRREDDSTGQRTSTLPPQRIARTDDAKAITCPYCANQFEYRRPIHSPSALMEKDIMAFVEEDGALAGLNAGKPGSTRQLRQLLASMYSKHTCEVCKRYDGDHTKPEGGPDRRIRQVKDLYLLSMQRIKNFAYRSGVPCGPKTVRSLRELLRRNGLPAIRDDLG